MEQTRIVKFGKRAACKFPNGNDVYICIDIDPSGANMDNDSEERVIQKAFVGNSSSDELQTKNRNDNE